MASLVISHSKGLAIVVVWLMVLTPLRAQLCNAKINFTLHDNGQAIAVSLPADTAASAAQWKTVEASGYEFTLKPTADVYFAQQPQLSFVSIELGCSNSVELIIRKKGAFRKMKIRFTNISDAHFGIEIPFQTGTYSIAIDTSKPLQEVYQQRVNQGFDITPDAWRKLIAR